MKVNAKVKKHIEKSIKHAEKSRSHAEEAHLLMNKLGEVVAKQKEPKVVKVKKIKRKK